MTAHPAGTGAEHHLLAAARNLPDSTWYVYACGTLSEVLRDVLEAIDAAYQYDLPDVELAARDRARRALDAYDAGIAERGAP